MNWHKCLQHGTWQPLKHISDATKLNLPKSFSIFGQNSQILSKCHEKLENILVPIFC